MCTNGCWCLIPLASVKHCSEHLKHDKQLAFLYRLLIPLWYISVHLLFLILCLNFPLLLFFVSSHFHKHPVGYVLFIEAAAVFALVSFQYYQCISVFVHTFHLQHLNIFSKTGICFNWWRSFCIELRTKESCFHIDLRAW